MLPNLFAIATKELSQDAFLASLLQWADPRHQQANPALSAAACDFVNQLIAKQGSAPSQITKIKAGRQWENIDVWAEVNDSHLIIIEDKTGTGQHSNQLANYKAIGKKWCEEHQCELICIYIKTQSESSAAAKEVEAEGYAVLNRKDLLAVLESHTVENDVYNSFTENLRHIEDTELQFAEKPASDWSYQNWQGFYQALEAYDIIDDWKYVPNQSGGFLNAVIGGTNYGDLACYIQIEQGDLCFKICEVHENRGETRNSIHHLLATNSTTELPIRKPARFGSGLYMTVAIVPLDEWLQTDNGKLDLEATATRLKRYKSWLIETLENEMEPAALEV
jgi:hypothetical protein